MPVSRSNRKFCGPCGADVTFAKRARGEDGAYRCATCASAAATAWVSDLEQLSPPGTDRQLSEVFTPPSTYVETSLTAPHGRRQSNAIIVWTVGGLVAAIVVIAISVSLVGNPNRHTAVPESPGLAAGPGAAGSDASGYPAEPNAGLPSSPVAGVVTLTRTAAFKGSADYAQICADAGRVKSSLAIDLIGEDSAYRGLSRRSKARRDLLALYIRVRGHCDGSAVSDIDGSVRQVLTEGDIDLTGEDSAIRALYSNDRTTLRLLGLWCQLADSPGKNLSSAYERREHSARASGSNDESAPRAIDAYSEAAMQVLAAILSARGSESAANACVRDATTANLGETSAWRSAMRNEEANLNLLLLLVDAVDHAKASQVRSSLTRSTIGEDSALRSQEDDLQGQVDALEWLIAHP